MRGKGGLEGEMEGEADELRRSKRGIRGPECGTNPDSLSLINANMLI